MSKDIKPGDLVMKVKPNTCCGDPNMLGVPYTVCEILHRTCTECARCGAIMYQSLVTGTHDPNGGCELECLIKIDPPAEGDSLPTRKDIEVPA